VRLTIKSVREAIRENESGSIQPSIDELIRKSKAANVVRRTNVRLGMMRHLYIVVDMSESMLDLDLKPARIAVTLKLLEDFVEQFFDQNPISQVGLIVTRDKRAEKVTELNGSGKALLNGLKKLSPGSCKGEPSVQNALQVALSNLRNLPKHTSKEILLIIGSLTTCDPSDINVSIKACADHNVRCSIIGLAAEVMVLKKLAKETKGSYSVILDEHHYKELINQHLLPPPASLNTESSLIRMGFPTPVTDSPPSMCVCHLTNNTNFSKSGYFCPQCKSKYCDLPVECQVCGLTLVSSAHLARSYHHLFPVDPSDEVSEAGDCFSCRSSIESGFRCKNCGQYFCTDCDNFIHDALHVCPGCASRPQEFSAG
jgi:transcription initiation factor TFIIH subunit 2